MTQYIDCFGRAWDSLEDFSPPKILHSFPIACCGTVDGSLFFVEMAGRAGRVWTHSLLSHGRQPFNTSEEAEADFFKTKQDLPSAVHQQIFGLP